MGINWWSLLAEAIERIPVERLLSKPPDRIKELRELQAILEGKPTDKPTEADVEAKLRSAVDGVATVKKWIEGGQVDEGTVAKIVKKLESK